MKRMGEGMTGYLYEGGLSYCVETMRDLHNEESMLESVNWKAAYLLWCLITNHPFADGNKRTAFQSTEVFLRANGYKITGVEPLEVVTILNTVASGQTSVADLVTWVRKYLRPA